MNNTFFNVSLSDNNSTIQKSGYASDDKYLGSFNSTCFSTITQVINVSSTFNIYGNIQVSTTGSQTLHFASAYIDATRLT